MGARGERGQEGRKRDERAKRKRLTATSIDHERGPQGAGGNWKELPLSLLSLCARACSSIRAVTTDEAYHVPRVMGMGERTRGQPPTCHRPQARVSPTRLRHPKCSGHAGQPSRDAFHNSLDEFSDAVCVVLLPPATPAMPATVFCWRHAGTAHMRAGAAHVHTARGVVGPQGGLEYSHRHSGGGAATPFRDRHRIRGKTPPHFATTRPWAMGGRVSRSS